MPRAMYRDGQRLPASYANFYIANVVVLLPTFDAGARRRVRETLRASSPTARSCGIDCRDLVWGLGAFHCLTQQWPA